MAQCRPQDFFDNNVKLSNDLYKLAFLDNITSNTFEELKKSGRLKADIPIEEIDIGVDISYDEAKTISKSLQEYKNISYGEEHRETLLTHVLSPEGLKGYLGCITADRMAEAVLLTVDDDAFSSNDFFIKIYWCGGGENTKGKFDQQECFQMAGVGAHVIGEFAKRAPPYIESNKQINVQIHRDDVTKPFRFATTINGFVGSVVLPAYHPRTVHFKVVEGSIVASSAKHVNGAQLDHKEMSWTGDDTHKFLPETAVLHRTDAGYGPMNAGFIVKDPMRIAWFADAQSEPGDDFASAACTASVSVIQAWWD